MTVDAGENLESLSASFPLTFPVPTPITHPSLISVKDLHREEDLLRNPTSFRQWWSAINATREAQNTLLKLEPLSDIPSETRSLLGPLASPVARQSLQRLTYLYEAALVNFAGSFKLWKSYLQMRMSYVLGKQIIKKKAGGKKRLPDIKDALEEEQEDLEQWDGGLDGVVGWEEWKTLVATFERALMWFPKVRQQLHTLPRTLKLTLSIHLAAEAMVDVPFHLQSPELPPYPLSFSCASDL
jgi:pre-mRNA-splicing factor SYF1